MSALAAPTNPIDLTVSRPSVQVLGTPRVVAESIAELLEQAGHRMSITPDVMVLVTPGELDWKDLTVGARPAVLLYEGTLTDSYVVTAVTRGVGALVRIDEIEPADLVDLVCRVAAGDIVLDHAQRVAVVGALRAHHHVTVTLTDREGDILRCVEEGFSVKQTARALGISPKTVENTQRHLFKKLGVRNRSQAVSRAHALGLLPVNS